MRGRRWDVAAVALLCLLIALVFADVLAGLSVFRGGDLVLYHYGMKKVTRDLLLGGDFPYWNRFFAAGQPLAANPAYELFYPLQLPILLPGFVYGFQLHILLHLVVAAAGFYLLLRQLGAGSEQRAASSEQGAAVPPGLEHGRSESGCPARRSLTAARSSALVGAASYALGGLTVSLIQYLPFLFSCAWMPWVFLFAVRWYQGRRLRDAVLAAVAMSMQVLIGEPMTMAQTAAMLLFAALWFGKDHGGLAEALRCAGYACAVIAGALCLGAVQLIPALDFTRDTVRSLPFPFVDASAYSLPVARPIEWFFPSWAGRMTDDGALYFGGRRLYGIPTPYIASIYLGLLLAVCALAGWVRRLRGWGAASIVMAISYVLAIGSHTPLLRWLFEANALVAVRYPEKFVISAVFVVALFGTMSLNALIEGDERVRRTALATAAGVAIIALLGTVSTFLPAYVERFRHVWDLPANARTLALSQVARIDWAIGTFRGVVLAAILVAIRRLPQRTIIVLLLGFVLLDVVPLSQRTFSTAAPGFLDAPAITSELPPAGSARIFNESATDRVLFARPFPRELQYWTSRNGLYPLMSELFGYATVMEIDTDKTKLLNVRDFDELSLSAWYHKYPAWPDLYLTMANAEVRLVARNEMEAFRNAPSPEAAKVVDVVPAPHSDRYWFASRVVHIDSPADLDAIGRAGAVPEGVAFSPMPSVVPARGIVRRATERPNDASIDVESSGMAFLVASVTNHRYWTAAIDGRPAAIIPTNICFQGVVVPPGPHRVEFHYRNPMIRIGGILSALALLAALVVIVRGERASGRRVVSAES